MDDNTASVKTRYFIFY